MKRIYERMLSEEIEVKEYIEEKKLKFKSQL